MILRPSSVSSIASVVSLVTAGAAGVTVFDGEAGSTTGGVGRIREMGGKNERLPPSSDGTRFGFGVCRSISETLSTTGLGGGMGAAGAGSDGAVFLAVIRAKMDFVVATEGFGAAVGAGFSIVVPGAASIASTCGLLLVVFGLFAVLAATRGRTDDLAGADFAALRTGAALGVTVFVVVFVGM